MLPSMFYYLEAVIKQRKYIIFILGEVLKSSDAIPWLIKYLPLPYPWCQGRSLSHNLDLREVPG